MAPLPRAVRRALVLACGIVAVAGWLLATAPAAPATVAPSVGWRWPLVPTPVVLARFDAPAGPYAAGHRGVDLAAPPGAPVLAAAGGVVAFAGRVGGRGVVSVDHPGGLRTTYEPVAAAVARGDPVTAGAVLGRLEATGSHCLPVGCLHWGLRRGSVYLDPLSLLGPVRVRLLPVWSVSLDGTQVAPPRSPVPQSRPVASADQRAGRRGPAGQRVLWAGATGALAATAAAARGRRRWSGHGRRWP